ncbi:YchJ family protein [Salinisphaera sp. G21_0]|uniref:YchJ family protein n=1 Tax=Salinisphaera sp. G21_0 TaxID=2821094 RepID=UPI001ADAEB1F|nr:YchJ family protein [Salinisphaera sp. G21_0]MBO9484152.1 YchJ family protein [Salinisphaera sp. G21_0]
MSINPSHCPCGSGKTFIECCQPYIQGKPAPTAETLMRSRYTAYTLSNIPYLVATTHPGQQETIKQQKVYQQSNGTLWQRLEVVDTEAGQAADQSGMVEFKAWFRESLSGPEQIHHERSSFIKKEGLWYFVYPKMALVKTENAGRNDPCPCGSGKKYKKCCAP